MYRMWYPIWFIFKAGEWICEMISLGFDYATDFFGHFEYEFGYKIEKAKAKKKGKILLRIEKKGIFK